MVKIKNKKFRMFLVIFVIFMAVFDIFMGFLVIELIAV